MQEKKTAEAKTTEKKLPKELIESVGDLVHKVLSGESTLQIEMGISDKELEAIYLIGYTQYMSGKYEEARKTFGILMLFNPYEYKYCFGLASSFKMIKEPAAAAILYMHAASLDPENPEPVVQLAECLIQMDDLVGAKENLERAIAMAKGKEEFAVIRGRAEVLLENVNSKMANA